MKVVVLRDTRAWQLQTWLSFLISAFLCGVGLIYLPGGDVERLFMVMGYAFSLSASIVLSKYVRDEVARGHGAPASATQLYRLVAWGGFFLAMALTAWGLFRMDIQPAYKTFLGVAWLYLITSTFTLAKTLRDSHEADLIEHRAAQRESLAAAANGIHDRREYDHAA